MNSTLFNKKLSVILMIKEQEALKNKVKNSQRIETERKNYQ